MVQPIPRKPVAPVPGLPNAEPANPENNIELQSAPGLATPPSPNMNERWEAAQATSEDNNALGSTLLEGGPEQASSTAEKEPMLTPVKKPKARHLHKISHTMAKLIDDWWLGELLCMTLCLVASLAIVLTLQFHNHKSLPEWPFGITLNAMSSVFTTIAKATLMLAVTACLGQLKWTWLADQKGKSLADFDTLDKASRGSMGCIELLLMSRGRHIAAIGAIITILALPISPVTQQAIKYHSRPTLLDKAATIPYSLIYATSSYGVQRVNGDEMPYLDSTTTGAFYTGVYTPSDQSIPYVTPVCATGNCTWPLYRTLGVCSDVANLTKFIKTECSSVETCVDGACGQTCGLNLPNDMTWTASQIYGINITALNVSAVLRGSPGLVRPNRSQSIAFRDIEYPIADLFILSAGGYPTAFETILHFCVREYATNVTNGNFTTQLTRTWSNFTAISDYYTYDTDVPAALTLSLFGSTKETFLAGADPLWSLTNLTNGLIPGYSFWYGGTVIYSSDILRIFDDSPEESAIRQIMQNIATSLSNNIQTYAGNDTGTTTTKPLYVAGQTWSNETYIEIQWPYLTLLFSTVLFGVVFLILTMLNSRSNRALRPRIWKNSSLAVADALSESVRNQLGPLRAVTELQRNAAGIVVVLERFGHGEGEGGGDGGGGAKEAWKVEALDQR